MIIAFIVSITLLPALLRLFNPPGEKEPLGYASLAPVDAFMERHRIPIIVGTAVFSLGGLPLLYYLQFDFNPMNLRSPKVESIATYLDLRQRSECRRERDRRADALTLDDARADRRAAAQGARGRPRHDARYLHSRRPGAEAHAISTRSRKRSSRPSSAKPRPAPTDDEDDRGAQSRRRRAEQGGRRPDRPGRRRRQAACRRPDEARRTAIRRCAQRAECALVLPLKTAIDGLRLSLQAEPITADNLPPDIKANWITAGRPRPRRGASEGRPQRQRGAARSSRAPCSRSSRAPAAARSRSWSPATPSCAPSSRPASGRSCRSRSCSGSCCGASPTSA